MKMKNEQRFCNRHTNITFRCNRNCNYCYARGLLKEFPEDMSMENFKRLVNWHVNQNNKNITLIGGEPTLHPKLGEMIKLLKEKNLPVFIFTNGIFNEKVMKILENDIIQQYQVNCDPPKLYSKDNWNLLKRNLKNINKNSPKTSLRFNITSSNQSFDYIIDLAISVDSKKINFSPTFPNFSSSNEFFRIGSGYSEYMIRITEKCLEAGIEPFIDQPIPYCFFEKGDRFFLSKNANMYGQCGPLNGVYAINPDLSFFPCLSLQIKQLKITQFKDETEMSNRFHKIIDFIKWNNTVFDECVECIYFKRRQCQGGCLTHRFINNRLDNNTIIKMFNDS